MQGSAKSYHETLYVSIFMFFSLHLQAAIWQALNHYAYRDAVFLAERLYAEGL